MTPLAPTSVSDICDAVRTAAAAGFPLEIAGGSSKAAMGRPDRGTTLLSTQHFSQVIDYDPPELVLTVGAGAKLADIEALVAAQGQMLAFEPFDHGPLYGQPVGAATIGGIVGAAVAGSRRLSAGSVRDHILSVKGVSGRGEVFNAGARVVKNVTGYDLPKLLTGSWGRLAVLTEVTLKVLPRPHARATLAIAGLPDAAAIAAMARALRAPCEVAAAAHLPGNVHDGQPLTLIRLEGFSPSVAARVAALKTLLADVGEVDVLDDAAAGILWDDIRWARPLGGHDPLWRIHVPPSAGARVVAGLAALPVRVIYDWAGGLVWLATAATNAAGQIRAAATAAGGHAMLVRGGEDLRRSVPLLHPEAPAVAALEQRVKAAFDPLGVLDPHRFDAPITAAI